MDMDPSLAFTAVLEIHPGGRTMTSEESQPWKDGLLAAWKAEKPRDKWEHARRWIAGKLAADALAEHDEHGARYSNGYTLPYHSRMDFRMALAIARSKHPKRVLAHTGVLRYGEFTESPWCAVCGSAELSPSHVGRERSHDWEPSVRVTMMGNCIATFHATGVTLWGCGRPTASTSEALSNLVTGGYFYHRDGKLFFSSYSPERTETEHREGAPYSYR